MENKSDKRLMILEASERSEEVSKIAVERTEPEKVLLRPDPEVPAKATRRRFSARYKLRILEQADGCESGEVGALLRREGLYWSNLQTWRRQRAEGTLQALTPRKRGRKSKPFNPLDAQVKQLQAENRKLQRKLEKAEIMLDIQKKVSHLLGISLESSSENEDETDGRSVAFLGNSRSPCGLSGAGFATVKPLSEKTTAGTAGG